MAINLKDYDPALMQGANVGVSVDLTDIVDNNGNEVIEIDGASSAVNYVRVSNSATGANPTLTAAGADTNISLQLTPSGTGIVLLGNTGVASVVSGSCTVNAVRGIITTSALTTGTAAATTFDLMNTKLTTSSQLIVTLAGGGTNTAGLPVVGQVTCAANGSATVQLVNADSRPAGAALNGTLKLFFVVTAV